MRGLPARAVEAAASSQTIKRPRQAGVNRSKHRGRKRRPSERWRREAKRTRHLAGDVAGLPRGFRRRREVAGTAPPCTTSRFCPVGRFGRFHLAYIFCTWACKAPRSMGLAFLRQSSASRAKMSLLAGALSCSSGPLGTSRLLLIHRPSGSGPCGYR